MLTAAVIFAAFVNNKVPVYLPHLMVGFSLAAGFAVSEVASLVPRARRSSFAVIFVAAYGAVGVAYYEKWYSTVRKSELVPYEETDATLHALVPGGPKYVFASPQFWTTFHAEPGTTFYSYTAGYPASDASSATSVTLAAEVMKTNLRSSPRLASSLNFSPRVP